MSPPERPKPGPRQPIPKPTRSTLAKAVGGLPLPPRVAKPPAPRVSKPPGASPAKPTTAKPRPAQPSKPSSDNAGRGSVAGRLGAFGSKSPNLSPVESELPRQRR